MTYRNSPMDYQPLRGAKVGLKHEDRMFDVVIDKSDPAEIIARSICGSFRFTLSGHRPHQILYEIVDEYPPMICFCCGVKD